MATSQFSLSSLPYPLLLTGIKIGIVVADWNKHITFALRDGAVQTLRENKLSESQIQELIVPGAFELPLAAQMLFENGCDAVLCLGCVIQGDTPHFDFVCNAATDGILQVGLKTGKPCIFGVLTTLNEEQAVSRAGGQLGNKGSEAALSALWMIASKQHLQTQL